MSATILAIEIGGTKLLIGCIIGGTCADLRRFPVEASAGAEAIRARIVEALPELLAEKPVAVGVGFGGPVDWKTGRVARSHQVEGWTGFPLSDWLADLTRRFVHVENDANAAAFAEATLGAGVGHNPVLYSNCGSGVGAGLVVDGCLYRGAPPGELELGHLRLAPQGDTVEDRCSGWALDRRVRDFVRAHPASRLARLAGSSQGGEARLLADKVSEAAAILDAAAADFAFGLSHAVHLLNPSAIVLGGGVALLGEPWRAAVARHLPTMLMETFQPGPAVKLAALGEAVVPLGAAALVVQRFLDNAC